MSRAIVLALLVVLSLALVCSCAPALPGDLYAGTWATTTTDGRAVVVFDGPLSARVALSRAEPCGGVNTASVNVVLAQIDSRPTFSVRASAMCRESVVDCAPRRDLCAALRFAPFALDGSPHALALQRGQLRVTQTTSADFASYTFDRE